MIKIRHLRFTQIFFIKVISLIFKILLFDCHTCLHLMENQGLHRMEKIIPDINLNNVINNNILIAEILK